MQDLWLVYRSRFSDNSLLIQEAELWVFVLKCAAEFSNGGFLPVSAGLDASKDGGNVPPDSLAAARLSPEHCTMETFWWALQC